MTAIAVTIAGSDSGGGAGIQADLKTFSALSVYGASVITALTAQNTKGVTGIHDVPPDFIAAQIDAVFSDLKVGAVKIGMLSNAAVIAAVADGLARYKQSNVVLDPVMVATSGDRLLKPDAVDNLRRLLIPKALVLTPNLPEAAALLDTSIATDESAMRDQAQRLLGQIRSELEYRPIADIIDDLPADTVERSHLAGLLRSSARDLVKFDPLIVRAFEYYTSTVFEVFDRHPDNNRSLFGGGRYSDLVGLFSDQKIPGIGFGFGDVTLFNFLATHGLTPTPRSQVDTVVIPLDDVLVEPARAIAAELRSNGVRTSTPFEQRKLGKELVRADAAGARVAVIVGTEDWSGGNVIVRSLNAREQSAVPVADVTAAVTRLLT